MYDYGNGSIENPYQIFTAEQLSYIREDLDAHYILMDDIDLVACATDEVYTECATPEIAAAAEAYVPKLISSGWTPIGIFQDPFSGSLDGNNKTISNLTFVRENLSFNGLFGVTNAATIEDVILSNPNVTGGHGTGELVGYAINSSISNITCPGQAIGIEK